MNKTQHVVQQIVILSYVSALYFSPLSTVFFLVCLFSRSFSPPSIVIYSLISVNLNFKSSSGDKIILVLYFKGP